MSGPAGSSASGARGEASIWPIAGCPPTATISTSAAACPSCISLPGLFPDLSAIPEMDKASYVKAYPIHQRMKGGKLPRRGVMVDESSGSSGTPTSWVRGPVERQIVSQMMRLSYRESVDRHRPVFILNAFALGAWATGMNVSLSLTPELDRQIDRPQPRQDRRHDDRVRPRLPLRRDGISAVPQGAGRRPANRLGRICRRCRLWRRRHFGRPAHLSRQALQASRRKLRRLRPRSEHGDRDRAQHRACAGPSPTTPSCGPR